MLCSFDVLNITHTSIYVNIFFYIFNIFKNLFANYSIFVLFLDYSKNILYLMNLQPAVRKHTSLCANKRCHRIIFPMTPTAVQHPLDCTSYFLQFLFIPSLFVYLEWLLRTGSVFWIFPPKFYPFSSLILPLVTWFRMMCLVTPCQILCSLWTVPPCFILPWGFLVTS